ncbi:MAG: phage major capsid protein [Clostridia bacterium]
MSEFNYIEHANNITKVAYLPAMRNAIQTDCSYICQKIQDRNAGYNGEKWIETPIPVGFSGGAGYGDMSGRKTPHAANVRVEDFREEPKEFYVRVELLDRLLKNKPEAQQIDYLEKELTGATKVAKWNMGRSMFGNGMGVLANVASAANNTNILVVDNARNLEMGIVIDIYAPGAAVGSEPKYSKARILSISGKRTDAPKVLLDTTVTVAEGSFITVQNSYGNEITGIGTLFDDSIPYIAGISKAANPWAVPTTIDANNDLAMDVFTAALRASDDHNGEIDVFACSSEAYDAFQSYVEATNTRLVDKNEGKSGFKSLSFIHGNREIELYEEKFVPKGEIIGIPTGDITPHMTELDYTRSAPDSPAFVLKEGTSIYTALFASYGNYTYSNPGGFVKIVNAALA